MAVETEINQITSVHNIGALSLETMPLKTSLKSEAASWKAQFALNLHKQVRAAAPCFTASPPASLPTPLCTHREAHPRGLQLRALVSCEPVVSSEVVASEPRVVVRGGWWRRVRAAGERGPQGL